MTGFTFPALLESFFTDRLMRQRMASPNTIASHRDTFRLLLKFAKISLNKEPSKLKMEELDASFIGSFINYLEKERKNTARSCNARLSSIHSFFKYVALEEPGFAGLVQRVLSIPSKRFKQKPVEFLNTDEADALLADRS